MKERIANVLSNMFTKHRIVFWYDAARNLRENYKAVDLPDVIKLEIANNEFGIKYRILRKEPEQKFLLYHEGPQPDDLDNWLLDVLLAHGEFRADKVGLILSELGLGMEHGDMIEQYIDFFRDSKRFATLKEKIQDMRSELDRSKICLNMLAVCSGSPSANMDYIVHALLDELADGKTNKFDIITKCGLAEYFWEKMRLIYGYSAKNPSMEDFGFLLFKAGYGRKWAMEQPLSADALVLLNLWKNNSKSQVKFKALSEKYAELLRIEEDLDNRDYREVADLDLFSLIDKKIISSLARLIPSGTEKLADVESIIRQRKESVWYDLFADLYGALLYGARFIYQLGQMDLTFNSASEAIDKYCHSWFGIDQNYRKFVFHRDKASQSGLMDELTTCIENQYANKFLLKLGNNFQELLNKLPNWQIAGIARQDHFFEDNVGPYLRRNGKTCIIISDALRYEVGEELQRAIRQEDRYEAVLSPAYTLLPSYTQLGMAALLPHTKLGIKENGNGVVMVDDQSSSGIDGRKNIISKALSGRGSAVSASEVLSKSTEELKEVAKSVDVLYVYHNRIDAEGDDKTTETRVFEACDETITEVVKIIRKLAAGNFNNLFVTSDHGFLYQSSSVDQSDFAEADVEAKQLLYKNRRFMLGTGIIQKEGQSLYKSKQLGLAGSIDVLIPKSVNRFRLSGGGSRYVHGGATLQEIVIPVIKINKKRQSDTSIVCVEVLKSASSVITSGQLAVNVYQKEPVSEKTHARTIKFGIYADGILVSDEHEQTFDSRSENTQERETVLRFMLNRLADKANGKDVQLVLKEPVAGTNQYKTYAIYQYTLRRSFISDFDF